MNPDRIKVIVAEPKKEPYVKEVTNNLESFQKLVGGDIEIHPSFFSHDFEYDFILNEEGKINKLPLNRFIWDGSDVASGNLIIVKCDNDTGEFIDLTDDDIKFLLEQIKEKCPEVPPYVRYKEEELEYDI